MLATKNRFRCGAVVFLALALLVAGCTPPGPRALLQGKKLLERGDYAAAVEQFKTATSLLATNAQAWNYLGVALQGAGQPGDAADAYQRALTFNRDLVEAHYNLGLLWLEQGKPDAARTELTAYTLRRANAPEGWLKLGAAQLHLRDPASAEKSFSTALALNANNAEALNGLGLARALRGQPREAVQYFSSAVLAHPDFAPALLNLATVAQQNLRDNKLALQNYRAYLALKPRPANWDEVNAIVTSLQEPVVVAAVSPPPPAPNPTPPPPAPAPAPVVTAHAPIPVPPVEIETKTQVAVEKPPVRPVVTPRPPPAPPAPPRVISHPPPPKIIKPVEAVKIEPEPVLVPVPKPSPPPPEPVVAVTPPDKPPRPVVATTPAAKPPRPVERADDSTGIFSWLHSGVTPLPGNSGNPASSNPSPPPAPVTVPPPPPPVVQDVAPVFPRYPYSSPGRPRPGDRIKAAAAFAQGRDFEDGSRWLEAMKAYQTAAGFDPSWFEAQYNLGVLAARQKYLSQSLAAYEQALAIQPDSVDARYNFAMTLKAAGYAVDAVNELQKLVAVNPSEVRAHLALGNLYAQQLRDPARARTHYLKVLELDPRNSQATNIRYWLASNPG